MIIHIINNGGKTMLNNVVKDFHENGEHVKLYVQNLENGEKTIILQYRKRVVLIAKETITGINILEKNKNSLKAIRISLENAKDEYQSIWDKYSDDYITPETYIKMLKEKAKAQDLIDLLELIYLVTNS